MMGPEFLKPRSPVTLTFQALWMVCALGAVVLAAGAATRRAELIALAAGFAASAVFITPDNIPDASSVGLSAALAAMASLLWPRTRLLVAVFGGGLAAVWSALLEVQGLPAALALPAAGLLVAMTVWMARDRPAFAPDSLREEALVTTAVLATAAAMLPGMLDGWRAAGNLTVETGDAAAVAIPVWTSALVALSLALGATFSVWSRR